jgi:hypothetical protein
MPSDGKSSHCLWQGELKKMLSGIYATSVTWLWTMGKATMNK